MTIELGMGLMFMIVIGASILWLVDQARLKLCPFCCKRIGIQAVKCPYCQSDLEQELSDLKDATVNEGDRSQGATTAPTQPLTQPEWVEKMIAFRETERAGREAAEAREMAARARQRDERQADRAARRHAREASYRAKGIEPGPLAWFKALPDTLQASIIGIGLAVPLVVVVVAFFRSISH